MGARIRHIALATQDPEGTARFYIEGLGLRQVGVINSDLASGYFLTDGYLNMAILKWKTEHAATTEGAPKYTGLHHFGFKVEDVGEARQKLERAGGIHNPMKGKTTGKGKVDVEVKFSGPDGVMIDLSEHGWLTLTT